MLKTEFLNLGSMTLLFNQRKRAGLTMVELIVVISILGVLAAILLPAVQSVRISARQIECASRLRQISLACHNYLDTYGIFPSGNSHSWSQHVVILPYIDEANLYHQVDFSEFAYLSEAKYAEFPQPSLYGCPADGEWSATRSIPELNHLKVMTGSSYLGNSGVGAQGLKNSPGYHGIFEGEDRSLAKGIVRPANVTDGLSQTAFFSEGLVSTSSPTLLRNSWNAPRAGMFEELEEFAKSCVEIDIAGQAPGPLGAPWIFGSELTTWYNHILPPNRPSCTNDSSVQYGAYPPKSLHGQGVNLTYCDGSLRYISNNVDTGVWRAIGTRDGAESGFNVP